jgi:hypothetical protein
MFRITKRIYPALVFAFSLFGQVSYAKDVYFCVGSRQVCFKAQEEDLLRFPNSLLGSMIRNKDLIKPSEIYWQIELKYVEATQTFENNYIPHYKIEKRDPEAFEAILRWIENESLSMINKDNRATVLEDADYFGLPELREALKGKKNRLEVVEGEQEGCPEGYIQVPGNPSYRTPNKEKDFCVMKYAASTSDDGSGKAVSVKALPWTNINRLEANEACKANGPDYHLISNNEWMAIARNIEANPANWSNGAVGSGVLAKGNHNSRGIAIPGNDDQPHFAMTYEAWEPIPTDWAHRRIHVLSNGEIIWDMAGNINQWVSDNLWTEEPPHGTWSREYSDGSFPSMMKRSFRKRFAPKGAYNSSQNIGTIFLSNIEGVARGGWFRSNLSAGVFYARVGHHKRYSHFEIGFRCTKSLP